ncbi:energy transducer TonB [Uliginosibacterium sp. 31-12]|uniref:energy transducer TonB n=1 Tax=Uliginosibacterium sp. 31-12 TaxID=3062781 RepID=UPI0026E16DC5|nr:energy transducer TonB [Uliginosibacterium sp. 31-12]MDO6386681.1 energy transducer TonB [Uliginosibacterium sp. 31-12]
MEHSLQRPPQQPGKWSSAAFSVTMHALLVAALFWGVQWQRRPPEPVSVELVRAAPPVAQPEPEVVRPQPPKPVEIKPPEPPPKPIAKPDIALKEPDKKPPVKKEEPKPEPPKPEKKPELKPLPEKKPDAPKPPPQKSLMDRELEKIQAAKSQKTQDSDRLDKMLNAEATTASLGRISADWGARISQKVKSNFIRPPSLTGDPKLVFRIQLLPSGEILGEPQLVSNSSGNANLEEAVRRAILKSSPLPRPEKNEAFQREIVFTFYPTRDMQ